jgi:hypothetical protein
MLRRCVVGFLTFLLMAMLSAREGRSEGETPVVGAQYLTFQIFTAGSGMTTEEGKHVFSRLPTRQLWKMRRGGYWTQSASAEIRATCWG